jgi:hydroxymethylpyrimidine/phosphomethylpyrimidine kinase
VLAIGGFDPSCGAGIVADVRSIEAMGAMPLAVATAITVQSGTGVRRSSPVRTELVLAQIDELVRRLGAGAVKIGQVPTAALAKAIAARIVRLGVPVVVDPVLRATGGGALASASAIAAIGRVLVPGATLLTVNLHEASVLTENRVTSVSSMRQAAVKLRARGASAVLVKGGHLRGDPIDLLAIGETEIVMRARRIGGSMHGTGCALASAVAARLACGDDVEVAVRRARDHVRRLLSRAVGVPGARLRAPESY